MSAPRLHVTSPLVPGPAPFALPAAAARHAQVLRLQPGAALTLFDGHGGEWRAEVLAMDRKGVGVRLVEHCPIEREAALPVTIAVAMPSNDRMDDLVEKATELGAVAIVPLLAERSVLRLVGERAERRQAHWQQVAAAACEQCGRNRVPVVHPVQSLHAWLASLPALPRTASAQETHGSQESQSSKEAAAGLDLRLLLGWRDAQPWPAAAGAPMHSLTLLSGPEGGLTEDEEARARRHGFGSAWLGPRVLRADTAPLAALASLALRLASEAVAQRR